MSVFGFYFLAALALFFALMVVLSKNPIYSVIFLILTFFAIFGHYILLSADFVAFVHLIVYAGAIMVLFLYVIMLLNLNKETEPHKSSLSKLAAAVAGGLFLVVMVASLKGTEQLSNAKAYRNDVGLIKNLGHVLFDKFLLPFEVSSVLFLAAMVGAVMLGKNESK